ncbi:uncharacterized protein LOC110027257 [Phalaenopsis equestris]|uniref:uncharacterized protein LOC110027257 n=1 Tax=Phalaenopsis equestris TaxID=78828 RepID=UPI0009E33B82|nr:uncharacterized protein LOC110027257 [Phalaenopsis equestris]XP_020584267.1 uncharacterized protein LOC110027257 [Phalaenopsis equestris]
MGHFCEQCDREYIKTTILEHEETFRNQVHELHRLYGIQKKLMNDVKADLTMRRVSSSLRSKIGKWNAGNETVEHEPYDGFTEEENNLELTLAIGNRRKMNLLSPKTLEQVSPRLQLSLVL